MLRIVYQPQSLVAADEVQLPGDEVGQRLVHRLPKHAEQRLGEALDGPRVQPRLLHLLGSMIVRQHRHRRKLQVVSLVHVGVHHLNAPVEHLRAAEDDVLPAYGILLDGVLGIVKPCQIHHPARTVSEVGHDPLLARPHLERLERENAPFHLYERHVARQFGNAVDPRAVNVLVGIVLQQVAKRPDAQFLAEHPSALGPYARQVLYVLLQYVASHATKVQLFFISSKFPADYLETTITATYPSRTGGSIQFKFLTI